jgi:hypothetical protein
MSKTKAEKHQSKCARCERLKNINADLLAALEPIAEFDDDATPPFVMIRQWAIDARAAIAKARGEQENECVACSIEEARGIQDAAPRTCGQED